MLNRSLFRTIPNVIICLNSFSSQILKNNEIIFQTMRVVYKDATTNESKHQILNKTNALELAKSMNSDLILVSSSTSPVVCKIENYSKLELELRQKEKEKKKLKPKSQKEMYFTGVIGPHDLQIKVNKVIKFLNDKHPVKVSVFMTALNLKKAPLGKV